MIYSADQNGEFNLDLGVLVKTGELAICRLKMKQVKNCKIEFLVVLGHWGWGPGATEVLQGLFLALGRMTYSHLPNRFFI